MQHPVQGPSHQKSEGKNKQHHIGGYFISMFFDQHKHIRNTGDKERNHHQRNQCLNGGHLTAGEHVKKSGGTIITPQKTD